MQITHLLLNLVYPVLQVPIVITPVADATVQVRALGSNNVVTGPLLGNVEAA